ncbi:MAG: hypothetical protein J3R72DRAFT_154144 [Linnemannia gamsii]|nr:MAG: hypothetical protein J3R72DRAFT_154144 [Linnemannia gamsii]
MLCSMYHSLSLSPHSTLVFVVVYVCTLCCHAGGVLTILASFYTKKTLSVAFMPFLFFLCSCATARIKKERKRDYPKEHVFFICLFSVRIVWVNRLFSAFCFCWYSFFFSPSYSLLQLWTHSPPRPALDSFVSCYSFLPSSKKKKRH